MSKKELTNNQAKEINGGDGVNPPVDPTEQLAAEIKAPVDEVVMSDTPHMCSDCGEIYYGRHICRKQIKPLS